MKWSCNTASCGSAGERQETSVIYKTAVHVSNIIERHFDDGAMLRPFLVLDRNFYQEREVKAVRIMFITANDV